MDSRSIDNLLAASRHYFNLPMSHVAKPDLAPMNKDNHRKRKRSDKAKPERNHPMSSHRSSFWG